MGKGWDQSINGFGTTDHIEKNETGHVILWNTWTSITDELKN